MNAEIVSLGTGNGQVDFVDLFVWVNFWAGGLDMSKSSPIREKLR